MRVVGMKDREVAFRNNEPRIRALREKTHIPARLERLGPPAAVGKVPPADHFDTGDGVLDVDVPAMDLEARALAAAACAMLDRCIQQLSGDHVPAVGYGREIGPQKKLKRIVEPLMQAGVFQVAVQSIQNHGMSDY